MGGSSGGGGGGGSFPVYQYGNMGTSDYNASAGINTLAADQSLYNIYQQANQSLGYIPQNPSGFDPQVLTQTGQNVLDSAAGIPLYAAEVANMGLDPQNEIYNGLQRQMLDQTRSRLASSGLSGTPYAAGVEGSNLGALQTAWENNKLNRATQAGETANTMLQGYGTLSREGAGLQTAAPMTQLAISEGLGGLAGNYLAKDQQAIADWLQYLGQGTQANSVGTQAYEAQQSRAQAASEAAANRSMQAAQMGAGLVGSIMGKG